MKLNHELTPAQEAYRRGATSFHAKKTLTAKAILVFLREHPGSTKQEILAALKLESGYGGFELLQQHKLARPEGRHPAKWYAMEVKL